MISKLPTRSDEFRLSQSELRHDDLIIFDTVSRKDFEIICKNDSNECGSSDLQLEIVYTDEIYRKIVEILSKENKVNRIFLIRDLTTFSIWTALDSTEREARRALYGKELEVVRLFSPVGYHFDFHIAYEEDDNELLSSGVKLIFSKKQ
jgi:hypothetical protein